MLVFKKAVFLGVPGGARDYGRVREGLTTNRGVAKPRNIIVLSTLVLSIPSGGGKRMLM